MSSSAKATSSNGGANDEFADSARDEPGYSAIVSQLHILLERWWISGIHRGDEVKRARHEVVGPPSQRAAMRAGQIARRGINAPFQQHHSLWWQPSERQRATPPRETRRTHGA